MKTENHEEREEHEGEVFEELSLRVIGCAIEVHRFLGPGLFNFKTTKLKDGIKRYVL